MVLRINEDDDRCPFTAGLEDVATSQVVKVRECSLTHKPYPFLSFRQESARLVSYRTNKDEFKRQTFHNGKLACRVVNILIIHKARGAKEGKPYSGIVRHLYSHECGPATAIPNTRLDAGMSRQQSIIIADERGAPAVNGESPTGKRGRSDSLELLEDEPPKRRLSMPRKKGRYTYGDAFCGAGGATQGAKQAGLHICWGFDMDECALDAYEKNHPSAVAFQCNAHDFPPEGFPKESLRVDILHLSPPCCYFSPAQ